MSLRDNKKNVFTTIGAYTSLNQQGELPDDTNTFSSVNNKKDILPFLLDVLKIVVGNMALMKLIGELFSNFSDIAEPQLKNGLKKQQIQYNASDGLSPTFISDGYRIPVKDVDLFGKLKTDPASNIGALIYGDVDLDSFDRKAYEAIATESVTTYKGKLLIEYDSSTDEFLFKPTPGTSSQTIGNWMGELIDDTTFIDKKEMISDVMNNVYGTVTSNQNKTIQEIFEEEQTKKLLEQALDEDYSFEISENDYESLLRRSKELKDGVLNYDMGCGLISTKLDVDEMENFVTGVLDSDNPLLIGDKFNQVIDKTSNGNEEVVKNNKETIRDGFFVRILNSIRLYLAKILCVTPQARTIIAISNAFSNDDEIQISRPREDFKKIRTLIVCILKELKPIFYEFIYRLIVVSLISLLSPIVRRLIKEKITQYLRVLKSLIRR